MILKRTAETGGGGQDRSEIAGFARVLVDEHRVAERVRTRGRRTARACAEGETQVASAQQPIDIAERLRTAVEQLDVSSIAEDLQVTIRLGVCVTSELDQNAAIAAANSVFVSREGKRPESRGGGGVSMRRREITRAILMEL